MFRVGGKIFAVLDLGEASTVQLSFKCTLEKYAELIELRGIVPAPYLARYGWVALEDLVALDPQELRELIKVSYELVYEKLSKKLKAELEHS